MNRIKEKFNFFVRTHRKISILFDTIRGFLTTLILMTLIILIISTIIHNITKVVEASNEYTGEYKKLYTSKNEMMNLYSVGDGFRTIVILPSIGDFSPVMKYKALSDSLSIEYRVVISEPLGYGYSLSTNEDRTSENIVEELRDALKNAEIDGPYILLTFYNSSLYADYYSKQFPDEVLGVISVNPMYSYSAENEKFKDKYWPNVITNTKFYSAVAFTGMFRWKSYIAPKSFSIDKMQENDSYGKEEIKLYRNRLANKFLTKEMRNEVSKMKDNMSELKDFKYSENLLSLQIITTNYRDEFLGRQENIARYANDLITNNDIQIVRTIEGNEEDYLYKKEKIRDLKSLISSNF